MSKNKKECYNNPKNLQTIQNNFRKLFKNPLKIPWKSQIVNIIAFFNQVFGYGKMHAVAKATGKELEFLFRVTSSFAHQRFMSSSYLSPKNLETSYKANVETVKEHTNEEEILYKLCGSDSIFDLCSVLDVLWPLVVLMLTMQLQWCPGGKFPANVIAVVKQI